MPLNKTKQYSYRIMLMFYVDDLFIISDLNSLIDNYDAGVCISCCAEVLKFT